MSLELTENIASRLKQARLSAGYKTAIDFARAHNIPVSTYAQHEAGKRSLHVELILTYSHSLNIDPYWLLTGQEPVNAIMGKTIQIKDNEYKLMDIDLLKMVFNNAESLFKNKSIRLSYQELIDYCFDVYEIVSTLTADKEEKEKIIRLTISSVKQGAGIETDKCVHVK